MLPAGTYRVQVSPNFPLPATAELADYLADLGVSHLYSAPLLTATPGSQHGYDVVDHTRVNPELGDGHQRPPLRPGRETVEPPPLIGQPLVGCPDPGGVPALRLLPGGTLRVCSAASFKPATATIAKPPILIQLFAWSCSARSG